MLAFVGPPPPGQQIRHLDGNRANPALANLCYGAPTENHADKKRHGTQPRGDTHSHAKLTENDGETRRSLAREYGLCSQSVDDIVNHVNWRHIA